MDEPIRSEQRHASRSNRNGSTPGPVDAHDGIGPIQAHDSVIPVDARDLVHPLDPADLFDTADDLLAPIGDAIAALPRPTLSPVFRARLHGDLVRLEALLAADAARTKRRWAVLPWLRRRDAIDGWATHRAPAEPSLHLRRTLFPALGLPAVLALSLTVALFTVAGLAYAAERSAPGDPLWRVHSAFVRWRTGRAPSAPESRGPAGPSTGGAGAAPGVRSVAVATVVRRTHIRPVATPGPVLPPSASDDEVPAAMALSAWLEPLDPLSDPPMPATNDPASHGGATSVADPPRGGPDKPPAGAATGEPVPPPVVVPPGRPDGTDTPAAPTPASASPDPTTRTPPPPPPATTAPPTLTIPPTITAPPDTATLAGTVRLRDGSVVVPLAGVTVGLASVAPDYPTGCDPLARPAFARTATTDADGRWSAAVPSGRWIIAVAGGCLGPQPLYLADFNGAATFDACAALTLPIADGASPSADVVIDLGSAPGCGPLPTATP